MINSRLTGAQGAGSSASRLEIRGARAHQQGSKNADNAETICQASANNKTGGMFRGQSSPVEQGKV